MYRTIVAVATTLSIAQIKIAAAIANLGIDIQITNYIAEAIPLNSREINGRTRDSIENILS